MTGGSNNNDFLYISLSWRLQNPDWVLHLYKMYYYFVFVVWKNKSTSYLLQH